MSRRAAYMYGAALERGPQGGVGAGLGQTVSIGTVSLMEPTDIITTTGHEETVELGGGIDAIAIQVDGLVGNPSSTDRKRGSPWAAPSASRCRSRWE